MNTFNELIGLIAGYLLLPLQNMEYDPEEHYEMAEFAVYTFYVSAIVNLLVILGVSAIEFYGKAENCFIRFCRTKK